MTTNEHAEALHAILREAGATNSAAAKAVRAILALATPIAAQPAAAEAVTDEQIAKAWDETHHPTSSIIDPIKFCRAVLNLAAARAGAVPVCTDAEISRHYKLWRQAAAVPEAVDLTAQRKKFMNWACDEFKTVHVKGDGFKEHDVRAAWLGWKAALAGGGV
jgi:hypothetical protein